MKIIFIIIGVLASLLLYLRHRYVNEFRPRARRRDVLTSQEWQIRRAAYRWDD